MLNCQGGGDARFSLLPAKGRLAPEVRCTLVVTGEATGDEDAGTMLNRAHTPAFSQSDDLHDAAAGA